MARPSVDAHVILASVTQEGEVAWFPDPRKAAPDSHGVPMAGRNLLLGKLLADSGGADKVVNTLLRGRPATLPWKMALIAFIIGIPMFFEIGLVLLIPVVMLAVHRSKGPAMRLGIPALAGLSVLHGFVPPHPGPVAAIAILHANLGLTLAFGLLVAVPTVAVAGPLFGMLAARMVPIGAAGAGLAVTVGSIGETRAAGASSSGMVGTKDPIGAVGAGPAVTTGSTRDMKAGGAASSAAGAAQDPDATRSPTFAWTLITLLSPLVLMLIKAAADIWIAKGGPLRPALDFIGDPVVAVCFSHVNDAGFWLVKEYFGLSVGETIKTWSVMETIISVMGLVLTLLLSLVL